MVIRGGLPVVRRRAGPHLTGAFTAAAYLSAVAVVELAQAIGSAPRSGDLASSPAGLYAGRVWELITSGLVVAGDPVVQLPAGALIVAATIRLLGTGAFWRAAIAGHIGATLIAYAGVGVLWLVSRSDVDGVVAAPDYGISCVCAGALGALAVGTHEMRWLRWLPVFVVAAFVALLPSSRDLAGVEHLLAFGLGALVTARWPRARPA